MYIIGAKQSNSNALWNEYKYLRNLVTTELRKSERQYMSEEISKHVNPPCGSH